MELFVRWAGREEWEDAMKLAWETFMRYNSSECRPEGIRSFREFITDERLKQAFYEGSYQLMVALDGNRIVGLGSLRNVSHLSLLFVDGAYHRRGIGKAIVTTLCEYLKNEVGEQYVSLTASPHAVEFYKKLGFTVLSPATSPMGVPVVPMEKRI